MKTGFISRHLLVAVLACGIFSGCTVKEDSQLVAGRSSLLLDTKPDPITTIGAATEQIAESEQVVVEGWLDLKAFAGQKDKAIVLVREILEDSDHGGDGHDPSSCPFCKRRMNAAPKAAVVFVDENKKALPFTVDELLPIEHGDVVVIKGTGKADKDIDLKITATGIYLVK